MPATWFSVTAAGLAALTAGDCETALRWSSVSLGGFDYRVGVRDVPLQLELRGNALSLLRRFDEALRCYRAAHAQKIRAGAPWPKGSKHHRRSARPSSGKGVVGRRSRLAGRRPC